MKREMFCIIVVLVVITSLFSFFVSGQGGADVATSALGVSGSPSTGTAASPNGGKTFEEESKKLGSDIAKVGTGLKDETTLALDREIALPPDAQIFARLIFGVEGGIKLSEFIVLAALWVMIFLVIQRILSLIHFFGGVKSWIGGFVVTCLISITGALKTASIFMYDVAGMFTFLEKLNLGYIKIIIAVVAVVVIFFMIMMMLKILKKRVDVETMHQEGFEVGTSVGLLKAEAGTNP